MQADTPRVFEETGLPSLAASFSRTPLSSAPAVVRASLGCKDTREEGKPAGARRTPHEDPCRSVAFLAGDMASRATRCTTRGVRDARYSSAV